MSKGSGRRRISPADGIQYSEETDTTNIEDRGGKSFESMKHGMYYRDFGSVPTKYNDYGSHDGTGTNGRYAGRGKKNDHRNWKTYSHGKQYRHNLDNKSKEV